jgi:NADPH2:quinone reductase
MKAVQLHAPGPPEALVYGEAPTPVPGDDEALVRAHAIGVGMPDVLVRTGRYAWMPPLPAVIGIEMSGVVARIGRAVTAVKPGDTVWLSAREGKHRGGCYAEYAVMEAERLYKLPPGVDLDAAAALSNYQVAYHLLHSTGAVAMARSVLVRAAAGGVGSALMQLAKHAGLQVVGLVGSAEKARFVLAQGADGAIDRKADDVGARVRALTDGRGVDLIIDPVGGNGFADNFPLLAPLGQVLLYGSLDGWPPDLFAAMRSNFSASPAVRLFTMHTFDNDPSRRAAATRALLDLLASGAIRPAIYDRLPLAEAARAHALFESGAVMGKLLLKP